ncbi:hypothetical protein EYF80_036425 [Liparis tanakae]|uniref:Uncharacterized protein n=1 Tax=Liparis tanakae TaxID=230148 RepID=A0A4Z2GIK0_9TELE|nr:hypothetical protein EYF80_036425 [Liparis tanakae]
MRPTQTERPLTFVEVFFGLQHHQGYIVGGILEDVHRGGVREPVQVHVVHRDQPVTCINITAVTHMLALITIVTAVRGHLGGRRLTQPAVRRCAVRLCRPVLRRLGHLAQVVVRAAHYPRIGKGRGAHWIETWKVELILDQYGARRGLVEGHLRVGDPVEVVWGNRSTGVRFPFSTSKMCTPLEYTPSMMPVWDRFSGSTRWKWTPYSKPRFPHAPVLLTLRNSNSASESDAP